MIEMAQLVEKNETPEGPMHRVSRFSMERSKPRILGDLGVLAVKNPFFVP